MEEHGGADLIVALSDRELLGVWDFLRGAVWMDLGPRAEDERRSLWYLFAFDTRFAELAAASQADASNMPSDATQPFEMADELGPLLRFILSRPGQPAPMAQLSGRALHRNGLA